MSRILTLLAGLALCVLAGCSGLPAGDTGGDSTSQAAEFLRAASGTTDPLARTDLLLKAADAYQAEGQHEPARQLLLQLEANRELSDQNRDQWLLLSMRGIVGTGNQRWARHLAPTLPVTQFSGYPDTETQRDAARLQAEVFELAGRPLAAAQTLIYANSIMASDPGGRIWQNLVNAPAAELRALAGQASHFDLQGWLELALALRTDTPLSLEDQSTLIREWQSRWPAHPAAIALPPGLELLASLPERRPANITLALPLSGPLASAGKAVREGFLAAYYQDQGKTPKATAIELVDTHDQDFSRVYARMLERNPDLVIGPLRKEELATLDQSQRLPVPVLALNYLEPDTASAPAENLYQFGLSPDDEAREIAQRLAAKGHTNVVLFAPGSEWGQRLSAIFREAHTDYGGRVLAEQHYQAQEGLRDIVAAAFGIDESRARAILVEETIAMDVEFEPRRRQDIDAIVMFADPARARQLKPMFAFYYGGSLPVLGSSVLYEGTPDAARDADLNGVFFTDIPWILDRPTPELRQSLTSTFPRLANQYGRLFALGADAYLLSSRLPLLDQIPDASIEGYTGQLTMTDDRRIRREQDWAIFRGGVPKPLAPEATPEPEPSLAD